MCVVDLSSVRPVFITTAPSLLEDMSRSARIRSLVWIFVLFVVMRQRKKMHCGRARASKTMADEL